MKKKKEQFKNLKEILKEWEEEIESGEEIYTTLDTEEIYEIKELIEEYEYYKNLLKTMEGRSYYKKYLKERRKQQPGLLFPDFDEIYEKYYEQKAEIQNLNKIIALLTIEGKEF